MKARTDHGAGLEKEMAESILVRGTGVIVTQMIKTNIMTGTKKGVA